MADGCNRPGLFPRRRGPRADAETRERFASLLLSALLSPLPAPPPGSLSLASVSTSALSLASLYEDDAARSALLAALGAELREAAAALAAAAAPADAADAEAEEASGKTPKKRKKPSKSGGGGGGGAWAVPDGADGAMSALRGGWLSLPEETAAANGAHFSPAAAAAARRLLAALSLPLLLPAGCLADDELARLAAWAWFCDGLAVRCACALGAAADAPGAKAAPAQQSADVWRLACVAREVAGRLLLSGSGETPAAGAADAAPAAAAAAGPLSELSLLALPWAISSASAVGRAAASSRAPTTSSSAGAEGVQGAASFLLASGQCVRLLLGRASAKASREALALLWSALAGGAPELAAWAEELSQKALDKASGSRAPLVPRSVRLRMDAKVGRFSL